MKIKAKKCELCDSTDYVEYVNEGEIAVCIDCEENATKCEWCGRLFWDDGAFCEHCEADLRGR